MARDFSKMTPQELEAIFQANFGSSKSAQPTTPTAQPSQVQSILSQYGLNNIGNQGGGLGGFLSGAGRILEGKEPNPQENDLQKLIAQETIKKSFNQSPYNDLIEKAKAIEAAKSTGNRTLYDSLIGNQNINQSQNDSQNSEIVAPEIDPFTGKESTSGIKQKIKNEIIAKQQEEAAMPEKSADAGRTTLAKEAIQNIQDVKKLLYPTGQASSFKRGTATGSNLPGIRLPLLGRLTPNVRPDNPFTSNDDLASQEAQDIFRKMGTALSGRQLIQTGVAARPEETQRLIEQFAPNLFSNPASALNALNQLEEFYTDYLRRVRPGEVKTQQSPNNLSELDSIEAELARINAQLGQ